MPNIFIAKPPPSTSSSSSSSTHIFYSPYTTHCGWSALIGFPFTSRCGGFAASAMTRQKRSEHQSKRALGAQSRGSSSEIPFFVRLKMSRRKRRRQRDGDVVRSRATPTDGFVGCLVAGKYCEPTGRRLMAWKVALVVVFSLGCFFSVCFSFHSECEADCNGLERYICRAEGGGATYISYMGCIMRSKWIACLEMHMWWLWICFWLSLPVCWDF